MSYLSEPKGHSTVGGYFIVSNKCSDPTKLPTQQPAPDGPLEVKCSTMKNIMASTMETEFGGLFVNGQKEAYIQTILEKMDHPQPATLIKTDDSATTGVANNTSRQHWSCAIDM